jgi:hypothetical protein
VANDRVLLTAQTSGVDNGVYVAAAGAWTRAVDMLPGSTVEPTAHIPVSEGTTHEDSTYQITTNGPITVGTDAVTFAKIALGLTALVDDLTPTLGGNLDCDTKSVTNAGELSVGIATADHSAVEILDVSDAQLRLTHTDNTEYTEIQTQSNADTAITMNGTEGGMLYVRGSANYTYVQIQNANTTHTDGTDNGLSVGCNLKYGTIKMRDHSSTLSLGCGDIEAIKIDASKNATFVYNLSADGNVTLGDDGTDEHTLNGTLNLDSAPVDETCSGITATFQAGEGLNRGDVVYYNGHASKMYKADANVAATSRAVAIAAENIMLDGTGRFLMQGFVKDVGTFAGAYRAGDVLYTSGTGGPPTKTAPSGSGDFVQIIGWAVDADTCFIQFDSTLVEIA